MQVRGLCDPAFERVREVFADAVQSLFEDNDMLWIQDYHFALLPQMVRTLLPKRNLPIGFFLHIPFPTSELYRTVKFREEILHGVLAADLIGFQTYEYARHFQSAVVRVLGLQSSHNGIDVDGHLARIAICPGKFVLFGFIH